jgi:hypothetical protein
LVCPCSWKIAKSATSLTTPSIDLCDI